MRIRRKRVGPSVDERFPGGPVVALPMQGAGSIPRGN